jgi:hypothetical protein
MESGGASSPLVSHPHDACWRNPGLRWIGSNPHTWHGVAVYCSSTPDRSGKEHPLIVRTYRVPHLTDHQYFDESNRLRGS